MSLVAVNFWAVIAGAVAYMALGYLWYSPYMFGNRWTAAMGWTDADIERAKQEGGMGKTYALMFLGALVANYVLAQFVHYTGAVTIIQGAATAFWIWLGFQVTLALGTVLFEQRNWTVYLINMGYNLVALLIAGAILAYWI